MNKADLFETISIIALLLSGIKMLTVGIYNPPQAIYKEQDLIDYDFLDDNPDNAVVCEGDLNQTHAWPFFWNESIINRLLTKYIPKEPSDYRAINITPVSARAFEKIVYIFFCRDILESHLRINQFG